METGGESFSFILQCKLPVEVYVGNDRWVIAISYDHKGRHAELVASNGRRSGAFIKGRTRLVETASWQPISVPINTVRHALALALVARGLARPV